MKLDLDKLAVTTFTATAEEAPSRGTVAAHALVSGNTRCNTCQTCYTNCLPNC
jgi:predicted metal-binding protein